MITKYFWAIGLLLGCLSGVFSQEVCADDTIHWFTINYPPAYFIEGEQQGEGFCDVAGEQFRQSLEAYHHQFIADVSLPRMLIYWEETDTTYCVPGLSVAIGQFPNTVYSKVISIVPPVGIMIRKAERQRFVTRNGKQASLEQLLQDPTLVLGVFTDGQYGERIGALIEQYKGQPQLYERSKIDNIGMFRMLAHKRVDYVPAYAFTVQMALDELPSDERDSLLFLPVIEEYTPKTVHAVCNDTPLGRQVIEQINRTITTSAYKSVVTERLVEFLPEDVRSDYFPLNVQQIGQ